MKIFKWHIFESAPKEASGPSALSERDIVKLAEAIGKAVGKELSRHLSGMPKGLAFGGSGSVQMDESLIDVGVSTKGIQNASQGPLGNETVQEDNVSSAKDKLKSLKKKE